MLSEGTEAPDFTLSGLGPPDEDGTREFTEYHFGTFAEGSSTLLAFYPVDFSPVCTAELCSLEEMELRATEGAYDVFGISRDSLFTHEAFAYEHGLAFRLLSDVTGDVCRSYDAVHEEPAGGGVTTGLAKRSLYVLDGERTVTYAWQSDDPHVEPDLEDAVEALRALGT
jgi:peroxiredoxin